MLIFISNNQLKYGNLVMDDQSPMTAVVSMN